jgi:hypothetical protein
MEARSTGPKVTPFSSEAPDHPDMPFRTASQNRGDAQQAASSYSTARPNAPAVQIPDGRKNSQGESLQSPTESWQPSFQRRQSWNQQDLKRQVYIGELDSGEGAGFTEGRARKG